MRVGRACESETPTRYDFSMEELSRDEIEQLLESEDVAHIAVFSESEPYVSPVSYVVSRGEILFRTGPGRRLSAIQETPRVCVEVTRYDPESGDWRSVIGWGDAYIVSEELRSAETVSQLLSKYQHVMGSPLSFSAGAPLGEEVVVAIRLDQDSGRSSGTLFGPKSRPGRL